MGNQGHRLVDVRSRGRHIVLSLWVAVEDHQPAWSAQNGIRQCPRSVSVVCSVFRRTFGSKTRNGSWWLAQMFQQPFITAVGS